MIRFFLSRRSTMLMAVIYIVLGIVLMLFPALSGTVLCWTLAALSLGFAGSRFWQYSQAKKQGYTAIGAMTLGVIASVFGLICLIHPAWVLSFLPLVLGIILVADGAGKIPIAIDAWKARSAIAGTVALACILPLVLGIILTLNPFSAAKTVIFFFGLGLAVDGVLDFTSAMLSRRI